MSRFFTGGSSSEDEEENKVEEEDTGIKIPSKYAKTPGQDESSSEDETPKKRVVRSAKEKIYEDLNNIVKSIKNSVKINDWNKISADFEKLMKQLQTPKVAQQLQREGITTPRLFLKVLILLDDFSKKTGDTKDKDTKGKTKMNSVNAKSFNAMKQKLKKIVKQYEKEIEEYKKAPSDSEDEGRQEEEEEEEEWNPDEDSEEGETKEEKEPIAVKEPEEEEEEENISDEGSGEEPEEKSAAKGSKWFVQVGSKTVKPEKPEKIEKPEKVDRIRKVKIKEEKTDEKKPTEMTPEEVRAKLKEILQGRGKRNTDSMKQIEKLNELVPFAKDPQLEVEILIQLVSSQFDVNRSVATHLSIELWKGALNNLSKILLLLEQNPTLVLQEEEKDEPQDDGLDDEDEGAEQKEVQGNLMAFIQRLDDEFNKSLQSIDPHTQDYVQRLQDENAFLDLAEKAQAYYERMAMSKPASRIAARRVEHIYYKLDAHHARQTGILTASSDSSEKSDAKTNEEKKPEEKKEEEKKEPEVIILPKILSQAVISQVDNKDLLEKLASLIYAFGDERMKTRTMLCHIYYHALHDRFYEARDMMLMSHLQESIGHMDITTQILFNRTMVQLGLCAFRNNLIKQAHSCLAEIYTGGRVKELLAQGITNTRYSDKTQEQEKQERKRQLPYHMHINLELLEAIHLICALLLEVPNMAANQFDIKKKVISRSFRRLLDYFDRSVFAGPPENTRDIIITAAKCLSKGDWKRCEELLLGLPVWNLVNKSDQVKAMVRRKVQEEGLRTYLFTYSTYYNSMSLEQLSKMFELPKNTVHSIVSKMMISEELHASWDQPTGAIVMHKVEPTRLQYLAVQFAEKAAAFVENNERILDSRLGGYSYKYDAKPQQKDRQWQERDGSRGQRDGGGQRRERRDGRNFSFQGQRARGQGEKNQGLRDSSNRSHSYATRSDVKDDF